MLISLSVESALLKISVWSNEKKKKFLFLPTSSSCASCGVSKISKKGLPIAPGDEAHL